MAKTECVLRRL